MKKKKEILMISKPLGPPWNDSGKNLVRDIMRNLPGERFRAFVPKQTRLGLPHVIEETIYRDSGAFAPAASQNFRLFLRLLMPDPGIDIYHFFFAPNTRSSKAARLVRRLKRKACVQNISSAPKSYRNIEELIFGDRIVVHSDHTKEQLEQSGIPHVRRIYPGISPPEPVTTERRGKAEALIGGKEGPLIIYPGDYSFSGAIPTLLAAIPPVLSQYPSARFCLACRIKTEEDRSFEKRLIDRLVAEGIRPSVVIVNETDDFQALVAISDIAVFPATSLYAKMDIPLALLDCLAHGKPLILSDIRPLNEILKRPAGILIPPESPDALSRALTTLLGDADRTARMSREGLRILSEHFDIRRLASRYAEIYEELRYERRR
jgi:glycosyltransferase involved in cell wall biosynthesis